jgi:hypothetical protein
LDVENAEREPSNNVWTADVHVCVASLHCEVMEEGTHRVGVSHIKCDLEQKDMLISVLLVEKIKLFSATDAKEHIIKILSVKKCYNVEF